MKTPFTITTKRSPEDEVWLLHENKIRRAKVKTVSVLVEKVKDFFTDKVSTRIVEFYSVIIINNKPASPVNHAHIKESEAFDSAEELINSISENIGKP